jgi:hypothetical protein
VTKKMSSAFRVLDKNARSCKIFTLNAFHIVIIIIIIIIIRSLNFKLFFFVFLASCASRFVLFSYSTE